MALIAALLWLGGSLPVHGGDEPTGFPISYTLDEPGQVSVAVYGAGDQLVRELLRAEPQSAGRHSVSWDGLDQRGRAAAQGTYRWKLLSTPGLTTHYTMMLGTNATPDYASWPGDHAGPSAVLVDGDDLYVGARAGETVPVLVKLSLDGSKWRWQHRAKGVLRMQIDRGRLYVLQVTGEVQILDPETGEPSGSVTLAAPKMQLDFDHEGAATAPGWKPVRVRPYSKELGYGWDNVAGIRSVDNGSGDPMRRDFHAFSGPEMRSFLIDIPYGRYRLRLHFGDTEAAHEEMALWIGAKVQPLYPVSTKAGEHRQSEFVTHSDWGRNGTLDIGFRNLPGAKPDWIINGIEILDSWACMDVRDGRMVACFPNSNLVQWLDAATGEVSDSLIIDEPKDIRFAADGAVLVLTGDRVVSVSENGHHCVAVVTGLTSPVVMNVDRVTGDLFVFEGGGSQRIKRFDRHFQFRSVYGVRGGRPRQGPYDAQESFCEVSHLAGDGRGGFVVTEGGVAPRRTSHFTQAGRLVREWYGGQQFFQHASPDPRDPRVIWMDSQPGWLMQVLTDYPAKRWSVLATYEYGSLGDGLMPRKRGSGRWNVIVRNGEKYLWSDFGCPPFVLKVDERGRRLVPVAGGGSVSVTARGEPGPKPWLDALTHAGLDAADFQVRRAHTGWTWADADGDGQMHPQEFRLAGSGQRIGGVVFMDGQWNVYFGLGAPQAAYGMLPNLGWTECGAPIWDWANVRYGPVIDTPGAVSAVFRDDDGNIYLTLKGEDEGFRHGERWSADLFDSTALVKLDPKGHVCWQVGPHASRRDASRGTIHDPVRILGTARGCVFVGERVIRPLEIWTTDGLYVGGAFDRRAQDGLPERLYHWFRVDWEQFGNETVNRTPIQYDCLAGGSIQAIPGGPLYWYAPGWNMNPVYELTGWDNWLRREGAVLVDQKPSEAARQGQGLKGQYFANPDLDGEPQITRVDPTIWFDWGEGSVDQPAPSLKRASKVGRKELPPEPGTMPRDGFSVRWTGQVEAPLSEEFVFAAYNKDGVRVWLDGKLIIDDWNDWDGSVLYQYTKFRKIARRHSEPVRLAAGRKYALRVEYYEDGTSPGRTPPNSEAQVHLCWESPTLHRQHIPQELLYPGE